MSSQKEASAPPATLQMRPDAATLFSQLAREVKPDNTGPLLPSSAPVSSLLPQLPSNAPHLSGAAQQALYAMLLQTGNLSAAGAGTTRFGSTGATSLPLPATNHLLAASASAAPPPAVAPATPIVPNMANWSYDQLVKQVAVLQQLNQPVPQSLALLVSETRKKEEKKRAKRVANRMSASTSRARKKAMVQEMTELNARLRRQALILALLPDLVIVIDVDGVITFCSDQAERLLKHKPESLVGYQLAELLVPSSRHKLTKLMNQMLLDPDLKVAPTTTTASGAKKGSKRLRTETAAEEVSKGVASDENVVVAESISTAVVSDPSFPMSVVQVAAAKPTSDENDNSDTSGSRDSKEPSSLTNSVPRSPTAESLGNCGSDPDSKRAATGEPKEKKAKAAKDTSSESSNTSSLSADAKNLVQANANLERNVRWHNKKLKNKKHNSGKAYRDDVIGADVTANNASARLSSLRVPERETPLSSEEDSGYRESNDSREETSSSSASDNGDSSEAKRRRKPLAPTCNLCLIRDDLTTIWCEVTSSVRTRDAEEETESTTDTKSKKSKTTGVSSSSSKGSASDTESQQPKVQVKELLLCLRPIRDGEEKVDEMYRFPPNAKRVVSEDSNTGQSSGDGEVSGPSSLSDGGGRPPPRPPKKRIQHTLKELPLKRARKSESSAGTGDTDIAESLVMMSSKK